MSPQTNARFELLELVATYQATQPRQAALLLVSLLGQVSREDRTTALTKIKEDLVSKTVEDRKSAEGQLTLAQEFIDKVQRS